LVSTEQTTETGDSAANSNMLAVSHHRSRSIIDMAPDEAKAFLLKQQHYCSILLPPYFTFSGVLEAVNNRLEGKNLGDFKNSPWTFEGVNHVVLNNKDGKYAWRPLEIIHPALYVSLVNEITQNDSWATIRNRFNTFASAQDIECLSMPVESLTVQKDPAEQIRKWWEAVEQKSIELFLDYEFIIRPDITECYAAMYTHAISWALHTKATAKSNRKGNDLIGNVIDSHIQDMRQGQSNGIPQGSTVMDLIAEMVLGYADVELAEKIASVKIRDYHILRYRDDYRIFVNNPQDGEAILKCLSEVMIDLGLKLNPTKTAISNDVISSSIKEDKLNWTFRKQRDHNLQKHLLTIHDHSTLFPNSGSVETAMHGFYRRIRRISNYRLPMPLISIVTDIAYRNPRTYPIAVVILSKLLSFLETAHDKKEVVDKIRRKFRQLPNSGHMEVWLQRISLEFGSDIEFEERLCRLVNQNDEHLWNSQWISWSVLRKEMDSGTVIDAEKLSGLNPVVPIDEVEMFIPDNGDY